MTQAFDAARLNLILTDLRLPAIKQGWAAFAERADKEGWPAARFLATLAEHTISPSAIGVASSAISPTPACFPPRPSTASTSPPHR